MEDLGRYHLGTSFQGMLMRERHACSLPTAFISRFTWLEEYAGFGSPFDEQDYDDDY
jgi:hypothetical protein